jgi:hypothetical protein
MLFKMPVMEAELNLSSLPSEDITEPFSLALVFLPPQKQQGKRYPKKHPGIPYQSSLNTTKNKFTAFLSRRKHQIICHISNRPS